MGNLKRIRMNCQKQEQCPCGDLFLCAKEGIYNNSIFKQFFEENDSAVLGWANNVLRKLQGSSILPTWINKTDNEDFDVLWGTITHLFAIIVLYARQYNNIDSNQILFQLFVSDRGLVNDFVTSQEQMEYMFNNYIEEFQKRGKRDILSKEGILLGELLRLIRYNETDEFVFAELQPENTGWCLGYSSPTWDRTEKVNSVYKAYEYQEGVQSLDNYPLLRGVNANIISDENNPEDGIFNAMTFYGTQVTGIDGREDLNKLIVVDSNLTYNISFQLKVSSLENQNIKFGVVGYTDKDSDPIPLGILSEGEVGKGYQDFESSDWDYNSALGTIEVIDSNSFIWTSQLSSEQTVFRIPIDDLEDGRFKINLSVSGIPEGKTFWIGGSSTDNIVLQNGINNIDFVPQEGASYTFIGFSGDVTEDMNISIKQLPVNNSMWFHTSEYLELPEEGIYYWINGIILSYNERYYDVPKLNFLNGRALSLLPEIKYIAPILIQERNSTISNQSYIYVYDFKVKPLRLPFQQGYLGKKDVIALYYKNNAYQSQQTTEQYIAQYLVNYKNVIGANLLTQTEDEEYEILFKVFSNRNRYIQSATLTLNGQEYLTDVNGEVIVTLPRGEWNYKLEAENFDTIEGVFESQEDKQIVYVQMIGSTYERVVTFTVTDASTNVPLPNVKVTFDNKINYTTSSGTTSFNSFPGTYSYTVEYDNYITKTSSVIVSDNTFIEVELEPVPYYNITFRVRDGVNPVQGVSIVVTGEDINEQTGSTNSQGVATGFQLPEGTYHYLATKEDWETQEDDFTIYNNAVIDIQLQSIPRYNITFTVRNNGLPLSGANISFNGITLQTTTTGTATFTESNGVYDWIVSKSEFIEQSGKITVNNADLNKYVDLVQTEYNITFTVHNERDLPLSNATVTVGSESIQTNRQGVAIFQRISGSYNYTVSADGYYLQQGLIIVNSQSANVSTTLNPMTYNVTFIVQINGQPVSNQAVVLDGDTLYTNSRGTVVFDKTSGNYDWKIERDGYQTQEGSVVVTNQSALVTADLQRTQGTLYIYVKDTNSQGNVLVGANVTINGELKTTNNEGQAGPWNLTLGTWQWRASMDGYNETSGTVVVKEGSNSSTIFLNKIDSSQFIVSFTVREGTTPLEGATIELSNGTVLTTNVNGQAQTSLIIGEYSYTISYGDFFIEQEGSFNLTNDLTLPISLVRKTTDVSIKVTNVFTSEPISEAIVTFHNQTRHTNESGLATFEDIPMSSSSIRCQVSKEPLFEDTYEYFTVNTENPQFTVELGDDAYSVIFTIKDEDGNNLSGVTIQMNSVTQYTDQNGQAVFAGLIANTYRWQLFKQNYISKTGSVVITDSNVYQNLSLERNQSYVTYKVQYEDGTPIQGIQIGDNRNSGVTNAQGEVSWYMPVGDTYTWRATSNDYFTETGTYTISESEIQKTIVITLKDAATIEIQITESNTEIQLPILNTTSTGLSDFRVDWGDGNETFGNSIHTYTNTGIYRIRFNFDGNVYSLNWSCSLTGNIETYLTRVLKWFNYDIHTVFYEGSFKDCVNLTMLPLFTASLCEGSAIEFCSGCTNLTSFPNQNLSWADNDFTRVFYNSGLVGDVNLTSFLEARNITSYEEAFSGTKITSVTGLLHPSLNGCSITRMFQNCTMLVSIPLNFNAENITDCSYFAYNCTQLTNVCNIVIKSGSEFNGTYAFSNTAITQIPTYYLTGTPTEADLSYMFANCTRLLTVYTDALNLNCNSINMDYAFSNTTNLYDISATKISGGISFNGTYTYCGTTTIPNGFFNTSLEATTFANCFSNCPNLREVGMNLWGDNEVVTDLTGFLQYCENLTSVSIDTLLSDSRNSTTGPIFSCENYSYFFRGCIKLVTGLLIHGFKLTNSGEFVDQYIYEWQNIKTSKGWSEPETPTTITGTGCYTDCTQLIGYNNIPETWK